jgi:predicted transcriptional regulator
MTSTAVLLHLKKHGQLLDSEISALTKIPLDEIRRAIEDLSRRGEISLCSVTRYKNGTSVEGLQCRISGYYPPAAPGRKPAAH